MTGEAREEPKSVSGASSPIPSVARLIHPGEIAVAVAGLAYIAALIVMREYFPEAHEIWLILSDLFTRGMAVVFLAIDGHSEAYAGMIDSARIEEMRAVYAANRLCAAVIVGVAIARVVRHATEIEWAVWRRHQFSAKWIFPFAVIGLAASPVAVTGLFVGFTDQSFLEFAFGVNWVDRDYYYFADFFWVVIVAWQFMFVFPTVAYFTASVGYGHLLTRNRASSRK